MRLHVADRERFIDDTLTMLRELDYEPGWVDRQRGVIQTKPSTGAQWFEIWRRDVIGPDQLLESSVSTIRRSVRIDLGEGGPEPDAAATAAVEVEVRKERFSAPERQVTTASSALAIYGERLPTEEGLLNARTRGEHWIDLGRDALLERDLLRRMADLPGVSQAPETAPQVVAPSVPPAEQAPVSRPMTTPPKPRPSPPAPAEIIEMTPVDD